jgi:predicted nucleic acid-binding protein
MSWNPILKMPDKSIVLNTGPILALIAATGSLNILSKLYKKVVVTLEVKNEICFDTNSRFAAKEFLESSFLRQINITTEPSLLLKNMLDIGEASVIQCALDNKIDTVCIDESVGRRVARLHDLKVTGSLGVLLKGKYAGLDIDIHESVNNMRNKGIYLSDNLVAKVIRMANDLDKS